mgnify:CR=1 FL=1
MLRHGNTVALQWLRGRHLAGRAPQQLGSSSLMELLQYEFGIGCSNLLCFRSFGA